MLNRKCPSCEGILPIGLCTLFDDKGNLICEACGKIVIAVDNESELLINVKKPPTESTNVQNGYSNYHNNTNYGPNYYNNRNMSACDV